MSDPDDDTAIPVTARGTWVFASTIATVLGIVVVLLLQLPLLIGPVFFFGPLETARRAPRNAVRSAAAGGVAAGAFVVFIAGAAGWQDTRPVFAAAAHRTITAHSSALADFLIGSFAMLVGVLVVSLMGAATGEVLAQARRNRGTVSA